MIFPGELKIVCCIFYIVKTNIFILVNDSKIKASADMFIRGNLNPEQMKARLRYLNRQTESESKVRDGVEGYFQNFRTGILILWTISNGKPLALYRSQFTVYSGFGKGCH